MASSTLVPLACFGWLVLVFSYGDISAASAATENAGNHSKRVEVGTEESSISVSVKARRQRSSPASPATDARSAPAYEYRSFPVCGESDVFTPEGGNRCGTVATCPDPADTLYAVQRRPAGSTGLWASLPTQCIGAGEAVDVPAPLTVADVIEAEFRSLPLPALQARVQPSGRALVNIPTIFYTDATTQVFDLTLLGQPVQVSAIPETFRWTFGDGATLGPTTSPGAPYPDADITHAYLTPGPVGARVDVTYRGTFSVSGGPAQDVPGTVTIEGPTVELTITEAHSELIANP